MDYNYSQAEINRIKERIRYLWMLIGMYEEKNDNGQYDTQIQSWKNEIAGLEYTLSGKN